MPPEDLGPDQPEEPAAAHDGEPTDNGSAESEDDFIQQEPELPLPGTRQLSLAGLGVPRHVPRESRVSMMSASVPAEGLYEPDEEALAVVRFRPHKYEQNPTRDGEGLIRRWTIIQHMRVLSTRSVSQARDDVLLELIEAAGGPEELIAQVYEAAAKEQDAEPVAA